jgi:hypothetical protein
MLVGVVAVVLAALVGAWVVATSSETIRVVVAARDIDPGELIGVDDLRVVEVGRGGGLRAIQSSRQDLILGQAARGPIPEGTVLNTDLFTDRDEAVPVGQVVVGAALEPGAAPTSSLSAGDRVDVVGVAPSTGGPPAADAAAAVLTSGTVWSVAPTGEGSSSQVWVSLLVPADAQPAVAQAAADGRLRLSLAGGAG